MYKSHSETVCLPRRYEGSPTSSLLVAVHPPLGMHLLAERVAGPLSPHRYMAATEKKRWNRLSALTMSNDRRQSREGDARAHAWRPQRQNIERENKDGEPVE